jgi:hypothetical protein
VTQYDWAALVCLLYLGWEIGCLRVRVKALEEILKEPLEYISRRS